jgi:hypothetical protein
MENGIKNGTTNIHVSNIIDIKIPPLLLAWGVLYFKVYYSITGAVKFVPS